MVDSIYTLPLGERYMILAPIVSNRKGEHVQLLENIRRKGFVRVRINGELHEIDLLPAIDGKVKNTIEVVIDRFKLQENMKDRLSESLELANTIADGVIIIEALDNTDSTLELSSKYACPKCGFCLPKLEPIMFSFNSPNGACKSCDGLGMLRSMDEELVIIDPELSLEEGVIAAGEKTTNTGGNCSALSLTTAISTSQPLGKHSKQLKTLSYMAPAGMYHAHI